MTKAEDNLLNWLDQHKQGYQPNSQSDNPELPDGSKPVSGEPKYRADQCPSCGLTGLLAPTPRYESILLAKIKDLEKELTELMMHYTNMTRRQLIEARAASTAAGNLGWLNPAPEESMAEIYGIDVDAMRAALGDELAIDRIARRSQDDR